MVQTNPLGTAQMARPKSLTPAYRLHKQSGQAYAFIGGRQRLLGKHGSPSSHAAYGRAIAEHLAAVPAPATATAAPPFIGLLISRFWSYATVYYTRPALDAAGQPVMNEDGTERREPTVELDHYRNVLIPLRWMYGDMDTAAVGCQQLEALREAMARPGTWVTAAGKSIDHSAWSRTHVNRQIGRIKRVFAWGVTKKLVPASVYTELQLLPGLRKGKTTAPESKRVRSVETKRALAIVPHVSRQVATMIQVQLLTGMRSTELCIMRPKDIDRTVKPWVYTPMFHKTQDHDIPREIPLGPKVRALLKPFMSRPADAFLFSPAEAEAQRRAKLSKQRETNVQPSQILRAKRDAARKNVRRPKQRYDRNSYYRAIRYGNEKAFKMPAAFKWSASDMPEQRIERAKNLAEWHKAHGWHPHQARHRAATDLRHKGGSGGLEAAQIVLGHSNAKTTRIYAEEDVKKANRLMEKIG